MLRASSHRTSRWHVMPSRCTPNQQDRSLPLQLPLCAILFASGASALVFETLWFRQAGLSFGNSVWASSLILSSFMAGLAPGNGLIARRGDQVSHRLRLCAAR